MFLTIFLSDQVLETLVDTNDEWITTRTGIKETIVKERRKRNFFLWQLKPLKIY